MGGGRRRRLSTLHRSLATEDGRHGFDAPGKGEEYPALGDLRSTSF